MKRVFFLILLFALLCSCGPADAGGDLAGKAGSPLPAEITDPFGVPMVLVPAGPFRMGEDLDELAAGCKELGFDRESLLEMFDKSQPLHTVNIDAFYIDKYEVTNASYQECVKAGKCPVPLDKTSSTHEEYYDDPKYADFPCVHVDWNNAEAYCEWRGGRLPTEAEWEKAARGGDLRAYPWGDRAPDKTLANYARNINETVAVGSYPEGSSIYGAQDMAGNVWEWVGDWYQKDYYRVSPAENPKGPPSGTLKVIRGGGWYSSPVYLRVSVRSSNSPSSLYDTIGFRCVIPVRSKS